MNSKKWSPNTVIITTRISGQFDPNSNRDKRALPQGFFIEIITNIG